MGQKRPSLLCHLTDASNTFQPAADSAEYIQTRSLAEPAAFTSISQPSKPLAQCPVCGLQLPVDLVQAHIEQELSVLADSDNSCSVSTTMAQAPTDHGFGSAHHVRVQHHPDIKPASAKHSPSLKTTRPNHHSQPIHQKVRSVQRFLLY